MQESISQFWDQGETELLESWYDDHHRQTFGIGVREATGAFPDLRAVFRRFREATGLRESICDKWNYCEQRSRLKVTPELASALADFLFSSCGFSTNGAFTVATLVVKYGFDTMCACD